MRIDEYTQQLTSIWIWHVNEFCTTYGDKLFESIFVIISLEAKRSQLPKHFSLYCHSLLSLSLSFSPAPHSTLLSFSLTNAHTHTTMKIKCQTIESEWNESITATIITNKKWSIGRIVSISFNSCLSGAHLYISERRTLFKQTINVRWPKNKVQSLV